jgi:hypothetical protein
VSFVRIFDEPKMIEDPAENELFDTQSVISFFCGNPIVEIKNGEIHLFQSASTTTNLKKSKILVTSGGITYALLSKTNLI